MAGTIDTRATLAQRTVAQSAERRAIAEDPCSQYWSNHSSLYAALDDAAVAGIEAAVRLQALGQYSEASTAFALLEDQPCATSLMYTIEKSFLAMRMGYERSRMGILDDSITNFPTNLRSQVGADEWDLILLLRANAAFFCEGSLRPSVELVKRISQQLGRRAFGDLSDVEVQPLLRLTASCVAILISQADTMHH